MDQYPEVQYLTTSEGSLAFQMFGAGAERLLVIPGILSPIEAVWSRPELSGLFGALATFTRVVLVDNRGTGLSDHAPATVDQLTEGRARDVAAVMDAIGWQSAALFGIANGGPAAVTFAAANPTRVTALVLYGSWARYRHPAIPEGMAEAAIQAMVQRTARRWGNDSNPLWLESLIPSLAHDAEWRLWLAHTQRLAASPSRAAALTEATIKMDIRGKLPSIQAPTLILHASGDRAVPPANSRDLAKSIPGARLVELDTQDHFPNDKADEIASLMQHFLTGQGPSERERRRVATIVFIDIVASTRAAAELGNQRWADVLAKTHKGLRTQVRDHGGNVVDTAGDGMFSVFEGPRQAIRCAESMLRFVRTLDLEARAGVHAGEVEIRGAQVMGLAVHTAARIADLAGNGEIAASRTIKDLLAGSTMNFVRKGVHTLKGLPDEWELFSVRERL